MLSSVIICADKNREVNIRVLYMYVCMSFFNVLLCAILCMYRLFCWHLWNNSLVVKSEKAGRSLFARYLVF